MQRSNNSGSRSERVRASSTPREQHTSLKGVGSGPAPITSLASCRRCRLGVPGRPGALLEPAARRWRRALERRRLQNPSGPAPSAQCFVRAFHAAGDARSLRRPNYSAREPLPVRAPPQDWNTRRRSESRQVQRVAAWTILERRVERCSARSRRFAANGIQATGEVRSPPQRRCSLGRMC
jgi:hypothetical protein